MEEIVDALKKLGFSDYESRVYATLAMKGEATASEIHKMSGVPRNKVYEVLRGLEEKGLIESLKSSPTVFRAINPESVLESYRDEVLDTFEKAIERVREAEEAAIQHPVWCVRGVQGVKNRAKAVVQAGREVFVITARREFVEMVLKVKNPEEVTVITDRAEKFSDLGVKVLEIKDEFSGIFREATIDGVNYRFELLVISGYESFGVYRAGDEIIGVSIKLPIIILFQKMIFLGLLAK